MVLKFFIYLPQILKEINMSVVAETGLKILGIGCIT